MKKKILFRADGDSVIGLGHLYRLFSLVAIVKDTFEVVFLTSEDSTKSIIPEAYKCKDIPNPITIEDEPQWITEHFSSNEYIIIADGYQFNSNYQRQIKANGFKMIYIDDLANEYMHADIIINHSPYIAKNSYTKEHHVLLALGTKYALVRPIFLKAAKETRIISKIDTAFVCFGGADPLNLTEKITKALLHYPEITNINIVLGGAYKGEGVLNLQKSNPNEVKIWRNLAEDNLAEVMALCNIAIVPASTILYELCCIKMPVLSGFFIDNQKLIYKGFLEKNAIYGGGDFNEFEEIDFKNWIELILAKDDYNQQIESQKELFDDKIANRHLNLIKQLC